MWKIEKPDISAADSLNMCAEIKRDKIFSSKLISITPKIGASEELYNKQANDAELHLFPRNTCLGHITKGDMEALYSSALVTAKQPRAKIYDKIMSSVPYALCPMCGHRDVASLDHFLPKSLYPDLAVTPINLIPCCSDCNKTKGENSPTSKKDQFLHPYYDNIEGDHWLFAEILETAPASTIFRVKKPDAWNEDTYSRVKSQFKSLKLAKLYAAQGARQLQNIKHAMSEIHQATGKIGVKNDLERNYRSSSYNCLNSWQSALYLAASESDWYCDVGFSR